jgi:hypothetical protein
MNQWVRKAITFEMGQVGPWEWGGDKLSLGSGGRVANAENEIVLSVSRLVPVSVSLERTFGRGSSRPG